MPTESHLPSDPGTSSKPIRELGGFLKRLVANIILGFLIAWIAASFLGPAFRWAAHPSLENLRRVPEDIFQYLFFLLACGHYYISASAIFCLLIWLPVWLSRPVHRIFHCPPLAVFIGMGFGALTGWIAPPYGPGPGTIAGALAGGYIFLRSCKQHQTLEQRRLPSATSIPNPTRASN